MNITNIWLTQHTSRKIYTQWNVVTLLPIVESVASCFPHRIFWIFFVKISHSPCCIDRSLTKPTKLWSSSLLLSLLPFFSLPFLGVSLLPPQWVSWFAKMDQLICHNGSADSPQWDSWFAIMSQLICHNGSAYLQNGSADLPQWVC